MPPKGANGSTRRYVSNNDKNITSIIRGYGDLMTLRYGTYDYLILLLGRLANFVSRDLSRKREELSRKNSGSGGLPPGMFTGMMPASEKVTPPMGFSPPREDPSSPPSAAPKHHGDLDNRTVEALQEWESILLAFEEIKNHFGPDFEPLGADLYPTQPTPFGAATHYRTYSIAGIWMNYYMGLIVLHRAHPYMPPVAMLAAGLAAKTTMPWAFELGRIAAGLEENIAQLKAVSTLMSAALMESAFPLFVAGVQVSIGELSLLRLSPFSMELRAPPHSNPWRTA